MLINTISNVIQSQRGGLTGLDEIFSSYNFTNMWSSENLDISGTNTTLLDYAGEHDLVNPAAVAQPTLSAGSANFNSKPSLTYDGASDYSYKSTPNWRGSDASGVMIGVFMVSGGARLDFLSTADESGSTEYYTVIDTLGKGSFNIKSDINSVNNIYKSTLNVNVIGNPSVLAFASTGSNYKIFEEGAVKAGGITTGSDNGKWLDNIDNRDNITIGSVRVGSVLYAEMEWVMSGYMPYISDANVIAVQNELKAYYGI